MSRLVFAFLFALLAPAVRADTATLPRYDLDIRLDTANHRADIRQTITWTNRTQRPAAEFVFNFYPHYRIPEGDYLLLAKTLEMLRLNPRDGIDRVGRAGLIHSVSLGGRKLEYEYRHENPTAFEVKLPEPVPPGGSITLEIEASIRLPNKQGRWGHWQGVHYLSNALPVAAFRNEAGWQVVPFVPWHQPFWNDAGNYTARITLPAGEKLACSAPVATQSTNADGTVTHATKPFLGRDFALVCSKDFRETERRITLTSGKEVMLKCLAFERHQFYADTMLQFVAEAIPVYSEWFGDYPHDQFTIAESFFGWNGNECGGMVLIDERVFGSPHLGRGYVEYLVSHETCHQWWYNLVGTNGYSETFMDEGFATYFTHRMLDRKHGTSNNAFMHWPRGLEWLPNIQRDNYRYASLYSAVGKNEIQPAAGELPGFGHLVGLFNGAYDRGSKALGMIEARLGEAAFMDFIKEVADKYSWKVLSAAEFRHELEQYTGRSWGEFFDQWIYGRGLTDWRVDQVSVNRDRQRRLHTMMGGVARSGPVRVTVVLEQAGELSEPTTLGFNYVDGSPMAVRIPIPATPEPLLLAEHEAVITPLENNRMRVEVTLPYEPGNVAVDPDRLLLDKNPGNNVWNNSPRFTVTPVYSMLNETDLTNDYHRWNFGGGPWIGGALYPDPWFVRSTMVGARAAAYRTQVYNGGLYGAYRTDYRDIIIGADGLLDHWPHPKMQLGFLAERRVAGPFGDVDGSDTATRAAAFARYVLEYGLSLYLPPMHYVEAFTTYQDNFLPFARNASPGSVRPDWTYLGGMHHRLNLLTPYWDPECGIWSDFVYAGGVADLGNRENMHQFRYEIAAVRKFPDWCILGPLADTRLAVRAVAMGALPDEGQFFALGGGTLFRGYDLAERQGSLLWVGNVELRLPLFRDVTWDVLDSTVGARNVWLAAFYDVGAVYANGREVGGVAHALGVGLRIDTAIFSFIERATLRFDMGKTINSATPFQFWFGVQHAF